MEKDQKKELDTEELKNEASNTVNEVKNTIKNVDIKKDSIETKGFVLEMFKDPLKTLKDIVEDKKGKYFKYAIIIIAIWAVAKLISKCFLLGSYWRLYNIGENILSIILTTISPIIAVLVMSLIVFLMNKNNKKPLTVIISAITTANIPTVISAIVSLLTIVSTSAYILTEPFSKLCFIISTVLTYFTIKNIFNEEKNSNFIKKFVIIEAIYSIAYIVLSLLKIYI